MYAYVYSASAQSDVTHTTDDEALGGGNSGRRGRGRSGGKAKARERATADAASLTSSTADLEVSRDDAARKDRLSEQLRETVAWGELWFSKGTLPRSVPGDGATTLPRRARVVGVDEGASSDDVTRVRI
jgi:hypothetical protein